MKKIFLLMFFGLFGINSVKAQLTVAALLELKETASGLMTEAGNLVDRQRQQAFIDLSAIISYSFDRLEGTLDKTDRMLTKKERALYAQLDKLLMEAQNAIDNQRIELFNDLDKSIGNAIADLPFTSNNPYPTTVRTPFIGQNSTGSFRVKIQGVRLNNERNYAELNGVRSSKTIISKKDEIIFEIPIDTSSLTVGNNNFLEFVLYKRKRKKFKFEVPLWVYPTKFAEITFHYTYTKDVISISNHTQEKEMRSVNSCSWTHNSSNIARVNQGNWAIDVSSVKVRELRQAPGGGDCYIESITPALVGTRVTARSNCGGARRFNPQRGTTVCEYSWAEILHTPTEFNDTVSVSLSYNDSRALTDFPFGITRFRKAVIKYYNGQTFEFIDNAYNNGFVTYFYDGTRESFQIKAAFQDFGPGL